MSAPASDWISVRAAARRLGVAPFKMMELVRSEMVETLKLPHSRPLVSATDLERLRSESYRPAQRPAAAMA